MSTCNRVSRNCNAVKSLARENIFEVLLQSMMPQNKFYYILQSYDGIRNAVSNELNKILFGIKECFSKLCCCEGAGVMKGSELSCSR